MDVLEFMTEKATRAILELQEMIDSFDVLNNAVMVQMASQAFDRVRSYIQIEENLVLPMVKHLSHLEEPLLQGKKAHQEMEYIMEHSVMMHVDEPSLEFKHHLEALVDLLKNYRIYEEREILPIAREKFGPEQMETLQSHLGEQLRHENYPVY